VDLNNYNLSIIKSTDGRVSHGPSDFLSKKGKVLFGDNFAAAVVTTMRANPVGQTHFSVAALDKLFWF